VGGATYANEHDVTPIEAPSHRPISGLFRRSRRSAPSLIETVQISGKDLLPSFYETVEHFVKKIVVIVSS
jgi:hypothetical protein